MLAGGGSRRFGGLPKGLQDVGGVRIIDRVVSALRAVSDELLLVANDPAAAGWLPGVPVARDVVTGVGGLAGLHAALASRRDIVVVAWDMPFVTATMLQAIVSEARRTNADAVLPRSDSPFGMEPFCAFYAARTRDALSRFLDAGGRAAHEFIATLPSARIMDAHRIDIDRNALLSVNTPDDLRRARAIANDAE